MPNNGNKHAHPLVDTDGMTTDAGGSATPAPPEKAAVERKASFPELGRYKFKEFDRDALKLFVSATAPLAAFTAGGLFVKLDRTMPDYRNISIAITVIHTLALHLEICSMLTSAMLVHTIVRLCDSEVVRWQRNHRVLIQLPMLKFASGAILYMLTVALTAWRTMMGHDLAPERSFVLAFGCSSFAAIVVTFLILYCESPTGQSLRTNSERHLAEPK
mmetsp:Transcript_3449/g.10779  ORF Transcript_3449/g.10779 Transcript_3449/m.10779 type:complete len:217 (-) Transcript_3449:85-735(-)